MKTKLIKLSEISIDAGTQQRERINDDVIAEYAESIQCGQKFPAITIFFDGINHYLVDGFHRYHAYRVSEITEIEADIHEGTKREAILFSAGVNGSHGLRPTNSDKRKSVMLLLSDEEWSSWSDHKIAKHCKVTQPFVSKLRKELITVISGDDKSLNNNTTKIVFPPDKKEEKHDFEYDPDDKDQKILELNDALNSVVEENTRLKDFASANQLPEDEIKPALDTISELREQIKNLELSLEAITISRDTLLNENAQLKIQLKQQRAQLKKLGA